MNVFANREEAGRQLAAVLAAYAHTRPLIVALPRGGVPVGHPIARALGAPLEVWIARKIGVPWQPEYGIGAVAEGGYVYIDGAAVQQMHLSRRRLAEVVHQEEQEVAARVARFRRGRPRPDLIGRTVILVDDGIATGGTALATIRALRAQAPKAIVLATPVAAAKTLKTLAREVDAVVCLREVDDLGSVGLWYDDFHQLEDDEVLRLLDHEPQPRTEPVQEAT